MVARRPHEPELQRCATTLRTLARDFDIATSSLRNSPDNRITFAEVREHMAIAGRLLLQLINRGDIDGPANAPPWLSWSLPRYGPRPYFDRLHGALLQGSWKPKRPVSGLIRSIVMQRKVDDRATPRRPRELNSIISRHRLVFLEAVTGWLGRRTDYPTKTIPPTNTAFVASDCPNAEPHNAIKVVVDWIKGDADQQRLLFIDLAKACSTACNFLADELGRMLKNSDGDKPAIQSARGPGASMDVPETMSIEAFHKLTLDLIDEAVSVLHFRMGHGEAWNELRNEKIPVHLREPVSTALRLGSDLSVAEHELKRAIEDDTWYGVRAVPMCEARGSAPEALAALRTRSLDEMKQELVRLKERVDEANEVKQRTAEARGEAQNELAREWRKEHHARLARLLADYEPQFAMHRHKLGGLVDLSGVNLGKLVEGTPSACQVLLVFAQCAVETRLDRFDGLDTKHLKAAVEKEIGWLARTSTTTEPPRETPPQPTDTGTPPSAGAPIDDKHADDVVLVGWKQILPELGLDPHVRKDRERVKNLNAQHDGPIEKQGRRGRIANHGRLMAWWKNLDKQAAAAAEVRGAKDKADRAQDAHLSNPGVRRELGFHDRKHPNKRARGK